MNNSKDNFDRAVWNEACSDAKNEIKKLPRLLADGAAGIAVAWFFGNRMNAQTTVEKMMLLPIGLVAVMLTHLLWSWGTAPRRIYKRQQQAIDALESQISSINELHKGELPDALDLLDSVLHEMPRNAESWTDFLKWYEVALTAIQNCIRGNLADEFARIQEKFRDGYQQERTRAQECINTHADWIRRRRREFNDGKTANLSPTFRVRKQQP